MFEHLLHMNMRYILSILMLHTKMQYGRTYVTHKNMISKCVCTFYFYIWKCVMSFSVLIFSEFGQMQIKMFQKLEGSDSLVFKIWTSA